MLVACHPELLGAAAVPISFGSAKVAASKKAALCALCTAAAATGLAHEHQRFRLILTCSDYDGDSKTGEATLILTQTDCDIVPSVGKQQYIFSLCEFIPLHTRQN